MISIINKGIYSEVDYPELRDLHLKMEKMRANKSCPVAKGQFYSALIDFLNSFIAYADGELKTKEYTNEQMIPVLFVPYDDMKEVKPEYCWYSLYAARKYARKLVGSELKLQFAANYVHLALQLSSELENLICMHEVVAKGTTPVPECNCWSSMQLSARDMAFAMNEMFYIEGIPVDRICQREIKASSTFVIRQLLESLGKGIIGYYEIRKKDNQPSKKHTQVAWKFLAENKDCRSWKLQLPFKIESLMQINTWANSFVHKGTFYASYIQALAIEICWQLLRGPKEYVKTYDGKSRLSTMYGDFRVYGYNNLRKDFEKYIESQDCHVVWDDLNNVQAYIMTLERPKILFAMHMPPPVHGASMVGKYISESEVVSNHFDAEYFNITTAANLEDIGKLSFKKLTSVFSLINRLRQKVKEFQPDFVYYTPNATGMPFYKDWLVVKSLKMIGCKVVVHYHNKGVATRQHRWLDNLLYRSFFKNVKVILLAEALYSDIQKYVKREDVHVCGNGVPDLEQAIKRFVPDPNVSYPLNILYLSNMMEEKGVYQLLEACALLKQKGKQFVCRFAGGWKDISEDAFRENAKRLGLSVSTPGEEVKDADVVALGPQYGDDKLKCFKKANLFVFPTYYHNECFPLVLLEAMQCQLACISTNEAAVPEIINNGKTGIVVEKAADGKPSVSELANAIERMIDDRMLCYQMGQEGRKKYEMEYTLSKFEERLTGILEGFC